MFYRTALLRCSELDTEIGRIYSELASSPTAVSEKAAAWARLARQELTRAGVFRALAELAGALEHDGPFLVQAPVELRNLERVLDSVKRRLRAEGDAANGEDCVELLDSARHAEIHAELLELAGTEVRRVLKTIDSEVKAWRRGRASPGSRGTQKVHGLCT